MAFSTIYVPCAADRYAARRAGLPARGRNALSCRRPGLQVHLLAGSYGRWVIDLERGWPTGRLDLEPLAVAHAAELAPLLDDAALHEFTGGTPLSEAALTARYTRLAARRSPG